MLRKNENLHSGFNQICDGEKDQMFMNIQLLIGRQGESWPVQSEDQETALLLLSGKVTFHYADQTVTAQRQDVYKRQIPMRCANRYRQSVAAGVFHKLLRFFDVGIQVDFTVVAVCRLADMAQLLSLIHIL